MLKISSLRSLESALAPLRGLGAVGLVPTMGALHDGHLSLVRLARQHAPVVVVSIFVNPLQFGPGEDFSRYPRTLEKDLALLERENVDIVFCPEPGEFYPADFSTSVTISKVSAGGEGAVRPGHFTGVATVVAKLFNAVRPDIAVFGQKDLQQAAVVRRMIRDLNFPIRLVIGPISREEDGLARSSRNVYLSKEERQIAAAFPRALSAAARALTNGGSVEQVKSSTRSELEEAGLAVDYVEVVDPDTMAVPSGGAGPRAVAAAVRLGKVRLIDNILM
jgi:pantoate--beta-alanine ligase